MDDHIDITKYIFYPDRIDRLHVGWLSPAQNSQPVWQQLENRAPPYCNLTSRFLINSSASGRSISARNVHTWVPGLSPAQDFEGPIPLARARAQREFVWRVLRKRKEVHGLGGVLPSLNSEEVLRTGIWGQSAANLKGLGGSVPARAEVGQKREVDAQSTIEYVGDDGEMSDTSISKEAENILDHGKQGFAELAKAAEATMSRNDISATSSEGTYDSGEEWSDAAPQSPPTIEELAATKPFFSAVAGVLPASSPKASSSRQAAHGVDSATSSNVAVGGRKRKRSGDFHARRRDPPAIHDTAQLANLHAARFSALHHEFVRACSVLPTQRRDELLGRIESFSHGAKRLADSLRMTRKAYENERDTFRELDELVDEPG